LLSIATTFQVMGGCPQPCLECIGRAGFSHVHWAFHWNDDFLYSPSEVEQIGRWLKEYSLILNDIHGSAGQEKCWSSATEYERQAGVELVKNRMEMAAELSADVVVMHSFGAPDDLSVPGRDDRSMDSLYKSLDELEPISRSLGVRIAMENGAYFEVLEPVLLRYAPDYVGLCYDTGHGNFFHGKGLVSLEKFKNRLVAVHLHDNDEKDDSHSFPFTGTVDWHKLTQLVAESSYDKCITMEVVMENTGITDTAEFLKKDFEVGRTISQMIEDHRTGVSK